jgi:hypothetical protein
MGKAARSIILCHQTILLRWMPQLWSLNRRSILPPSNYSLFLHSWLRLSHPQRLIHLKGNGRGFDQALLELLLLLEHQPISQDDATATTAASQTVANQAKTLAWLTGRVEQLEAQLEQQQRENRETFQQGDSDDLAQLQHLQAENLRLNDELHLTRSRLDRIQSLLSGSEAKDDPQHHSRQTPAEITPHAPMPTTTGESPNPVVMAPSDLDPDALRALHAILDFNDHSATSHGDRWAISFPAMKELLKQVGKATQP